MKGDEDTGAHKKRDTGPPRLLQTRLAALPHNTEEEKGVPGSLWAGLRSPATVFLFIQVAFPPEPASQVPLRITGQARCKERFVGDQQAEGAGPRGKPCLL